MVFRTVDPSGDDGEGTHDSNIAGVFLNASDATAFAVRSSREACEEQKMMRHLEQRKPDGMMMCMAVSSDQRGPRYGFEVDRLPWCSNP